MAPVSYVIIIVVAIILIVYLRKISDTGPLTKCDPTSWASQCGDGYCACTGANRGYCVAAGDADYAFGYSWQGAWNSPAAVNAACPDECAAKAKAAGAPNWAFQWGMSGEYPLNCNYGTIVPGSCAAKVTGWASDSAAAKAPICGGGASGCKLPVFAGSPAGAAVCLADGDCPSGATCAHAACKSDSDCVNLTGPCKNGTCTTGTCSDGACASDEDCLTMCCSGTMGMDCAGAFPCVNNEKCTKSVTGVGFKCCGGEACTADPSVGCVNGKCQAVGLAAMSCGMDTAFVPTAAQQAQLAAACSSKPLGDACSVDFGSAGTLSGACGRSCTDPSDPLKCYPKNLCWSVSGQTTLSQPTGACQSTTKTAGVCFGS